MKTPILVKELKDYPFHEVTRLNCEDDMLKFKAPVLGNSSTAIIPLISGVTLVYYAGKPEKTYQMRYSQYYQNKILICLMLSGRATHKLQESIDASVKKNQSFIYAVEEEEKFSLVEYTQAKSFEMASLVFDKEAFDYCLDKFFDKSHKKERETCIKAIYSGKEPGNLFDISKEVNLIVKQILKCRLTKNFRRVYLECKMYELMAHYFQSICNIQNKEIHFSTEDIRKLQEIKQQLNTYSGTDICIDTLCKTHGLNRFKLASGFQSLFNISVIKYYRQQVLKKALNEIKENNTSITEIALKYGYNSLQSFSRAFYKEFNLRPSDV